MRCTIIRASNNASTIGVVHAEKVLIIKDLLSAMFSMERRCPLRDEDVQLFEEALIEIVDNFSESWLNLNSGHPLQTL